VLACVGPPTEKCVDEKAATELRPLGGQYRESLLPDAF
jgi:hypothetical protein